MGRRLVGGEYGGAGSEPQNLTNYQDISNICPLESTKMDHRRSMLPLPRWRL
jgi:hypothetical protein